MMNQTKHEAKKIIAEAEGTRTPSKKRSKKETETAITDFTEKRQASKKAKSAKAGTSTKKPVPAKNADSVQKPARSKGTPATADIKRIAVVGLAGNVRSAGYDEKGSRLQIEFDKSIWEYPNTTAEEWKGLKASLTDKDSDTGAYFRKAFRGRASSSKRVYDKSTEGASKEAPAYTEVK